MKASEFKKILKPLIKQTIKEVLFEEGVLSGIVTEVVDGLSSKQVVTETKNNTHRTREETAIREQKHEKDRQERIRRLNETSKIGSVFEGTKEIIDSSGHDPLANIDAGDSGVDITAIEKLASGKWKQLI